MRLHELLKQYRQVADELSRTQKMRDEAQQKIDNLIALGDLEGDRDQRKFSDARSSFDLAGGRLKYLTKSTAKLSAEVLEEFDAQRARFNAVIKARREKLLGDLEAALRPFFPGAERDLKRVVDGINCPVLRENGKAHWYPEFREHGTDEDKINEGERFVAHAARTLKKFGLQAGD